MQSGYGDNRTMTDIQFTYLTKVLDNYDIEFEIRLVPSLDSVTMNRCETKTYSLHNLLLYNVFHLF